MKYASDNKSREKHFIEEIETIPQKRSNAKKIFIGILVAAIVASGVIVPVVVVRQNEISENEKTVTPSEVMQELQRQEVSPLLQKQQGL